MGRLVQPVPTNVVTATAPSPCPPEGSPYARYPHNPRVRNVQHPLTPARAPTSVAAIDPIECNTGSRVTNPVGPSKAAVRDHGHRQGHNSAQRPAALPPPAVAQKDCGGTRQPEVANSGGILPCARQIWSLWGYPAGWGSQIRSGSCSFCAPECRREHARAFKCAHTNEDTHARCTHAGGHTPWLGNLHHPIEEDLEALGEGAHFNHEVREHKEVGVPRNHGLGVLPVGHSARGVARARSWALPGPLWSWRFEGSVMTPPGQGGAVLHWEAVRGGGYALVSVPHPNPPKGTIIIINSDVLRAVKRRLTEVGLISPVRAGAPTDRNVPVKSTPGRPSARQRTGCERSGCGCLTVTGPCTCRWPHFAQSTAGAMPYPSWILPCAGRG